MSSTYKATGINLKTSPLGESDRLLTILTQEHGLIRVVSPGSRKHQSGLRGLSELFVVNQLLLVKGRSLDKIIQADSVETYPALSSDLRKLTASQYLAELTLFQALSEHPQEELFTLLREHLRRLDTFPATLALPCLVHATYHLLAIAGVAPRVHACCMTQDPLEPNFQDANWRVGFSPSAGGTVKLEQSGSVTLRKPSPSHVGSIQEPIHLPAAVSSTPSSKERSPISRSGSSSRRVIDPPMLVTATELALLQHLSRPELLHPDGTLSPDCDDAFLGTPPADAWKGLERLLRHYAQYHFDHLIRSAVLIDTCFLSSHPLDHDVV